MFAPDGSAIVGSAAKAIRLWSTATGHVVKELPGHSEEITALAVSPDGACVASGAWGQGVLHLVSTATGTVLHTLTQHSKAVSALTFSPDGATLASAAQDMTVCIWATATGRLLRTFEHGASDRARSVTSLAFSSDGRTVTSLSEDLQLRVWDVSTGRSVHSVAIPTDITFAPVLSPDGGIVAFPAEEWQGESGVGRDSGTVQLCSAATGTPGRRGAVVRECEQQQPQCRSARVNRRGTREHASAWAGGGGGAPPLVIAEGSRARGQ